MTLENGALLNQRYRIQYTLAQGGMGAIYQAQDETLGIVVAVKENLIANTDYSRQFHREATILAGLRHPNLPRVTDHFVIDGQGQYLAMDYIDGEDLRQRLKRTGILPESEVLMIGIAICDALEYLHSRLPPILHRDIKPGNIKITPDGRIYLVDFGLAKIAHSGQATTIGAQSLTPGYAPPEQYGQGTEPRSDLYALSATLYAALCDFIPEDGLARAMGSAVLTSLRLRNPQVSERTAQVIERGMAVDPERRYQSAAEFRQSLLGSNTQVRRRIEENNEIRVTPSPSQSISAADVSSTTVSAPRLADPISGNPSSTPLAAAPKEYARRPRPSRRITVGVSMFGLLAVLAAGGLLARGFTPRPTLAPTSGLTASIGAPVPTLTLIPISLANTQAPTAPETLAPTLTQTATLQPSPSATLTGSGLGQIAFASTRSGKPQIWIMDVDGGDLHQVTDLSDGACQPDWSPDGQRLVFISPCAGKQDQYKGSSLYLMNVDGSGILPLDTDPGGDYEPTWSPDGKTIAFTTLRDGRPHIYLYNLADDTVISLSRLSSYDRQPAWSPDGQSIAFTTNRLGLIQVWIMAADGSGAREFGSNNAGTSYLPVWSQDGKVLYYSQGNGLSVLAAKKLADGSAQFPVSEKVSPVADAVLSPDGYWVAFESWPAGGNQDIYRMTRTGTLLTRLTDDPALDFDPDWSP